MDIGDVATWGSVLVSAAALIWVRRESVRAGRAEARIEQLERLEAVKPRLTLAKTRPVENGLVEHEYLITNDGNEIAQGVSVDAETLRRVSISFGGNVLSLEPGQTTSFVHITCVPEALPRSVRVKWMLPFEGSRYVDLPAS